MAFSFNSFTDDIYSVASVLKVSCSTTDIYSLNLFFVHRQLYLRGLPEPLFKFPLRDRIQHSEDKGKGSEFSGPNVRNLMSNHLADHAANGFVVLRSKIRRLLGVHRASLKALVEHLSRVASRALKNKMDAKNLAIVFSPVIFGEDEIPQGDLLSVQPTKVRFVITCFLVLIGVGFCDGEPHRQCAYIV